MTPGPSAYASKMCFRRVVSASCCPNASALSCSCIPSSSEDSDNNANRRDRIPIASAVAGGSLGCASRTPSGAASHGASLYRSAVAGANAPSASGAGSAGSHSRVDSDSDSEPRHDAGGWSASAPSTHSARSNREGSRGRGPASFANRRMSPAYSLAPNASRTPIDASNGRKHVKSAGRTWR